MPVANCLFLDRWNVDADAVVRAWSAHAQIQPDEVTVNVLTATAQGGKAYAVMAWLYLPSLWSNTSAERVQRGLAHALSEHAGVPLTAVFVLTQKVQSGWVVENGETVRWD